MDKDFSLSYSSFDNVDIDEEIEKINKASSVYLKFDAKRKNMLFLLGILFAANKKIHIINQYDLQLSKEGKSFDKMAYRWQQLGIGPNITNYNNNTNNIFLICPVRLSTDEQNDFRSDYVTSKENEGYKVYDPNRDTNQIDETGYRICTDNARAIGSADEVHILYDRNSRGSLFDLGVAYYFNKQLTIVNEKDLIYDNNDFGDKIILNWNNQNIIKPMTLKLGGTK